MATENQIKETPDNERIVLNDHCIEYVQQQFPGLDHDQVREAIEEAGPVLKDILEYARRKFKA